MTKNTIAAVALSVGFLILWNKFYRPTASRSSPAGGAYEQSAPRQNPSQNSVGLMSTEDTNKSEAHQQEQTFEVGNETARITFTTRGGAIKKYELKRRAESPSRAVSAAQENEGDYFINLVPDGGMLFATTHLNGIALSDAKLKYRGNDAVIFEQTTDLSKAGEGKYLVRKTYRFSTGNDKNDATSFFKGLDIEIIPQSVGAQKSEVKKSTVEDNLPMSVLTMVFSKGLADSTHKSAKTENDERENISLNSIKYLTTVGKKVHRAKAGSEIMLADKNINTLWLASDNRYYIAVVIPDSGFKEGDSLKITKPNKYSYPVATMSLSDKDGRSEPTRRSFNIYIGGKSLSLLKKTAPHLEKTIDFGLMGGLGKFFLESLISINKFTHNYGWAIVILSLIIQIITLPLSLKSLKATADMKRLQPLMREIQTRYKDDPKRMNVEMMNLYKTHKVNPLSGCLPMLLQMPIFWALFTTLRNAYELKDAGWILWIKDLSAHDPFYVLPILMGLGMFGQQFMSGATQDPQNKMMGYVFPAVFTFMFLKFPSGVVLYWLINSILSISIQFFFLEKEVIKEHQQVQPTGK